MEDFYLGTVMMWSANLIPRGWLPCDGRRLPIASNQALHSLLGNNFGGDGVNDFALPNYCARAPAGVTPSGPGYVMGQSGGQPIVTLTADNFPQHSHPLMAVSAAGNATSFAGGVVLAGVGTSPNVPTAPAIYGPGEVGNMVALSANSIGGTGGSNPRANVQPSLALNFIIAVTGIYPSRH